jgi:hypothetical protein
MNMNNHKETFVSDETPLRIRWENDLQNRYYEAHLAVDLFGGWTLTRVWGRRGSPMGNLRDDPCESWRDGLDKLAVIQTKRKQNLYRVVSGVLPDKPVVDKPVERIAQASKPAKRSRTPGGAMMNPVTRQPVLTRIAI